MGAATRKLLAISGSPFLREGMTFGLDRLDRFGKVGKDIRSILIEKNGFFCFEQALRFFPSATGEASWGIHEWNQRDLWKYEYCGLADSAFCFAEDVFGGQFCIIDEKIGVFNPETGEIEAMADDLEGWSSKLLSDYNVFVGYKFAHDWQKLHGRMQDRYRLMPKKPFVLGGAYELENLEGMDSVRVMKSYGNLAHQIHDLPDGSQVKFEVL